MRTLLLACLLLLSAICRGQIITTFAGGGTSFCENCPATTTRITDPNGCTFDTDGNYLFTGGLGENRIRIIDKLGIVKTVAGKGTTGFSGDGGPAILAEFNVPEIIRFDTGGNLYISDYQNFRIRKINANTGIITTIAGIGTAGYNGDDIPATAAKFVPSDFVFDNAGNIYISDYNGRRVRKIDTSGIIHTIAGNGTVGSSGDGGPATAAQLNPKGLAIDNIGNLFIADPYANVVRMINTTGTISTVAGNGNWIYAGDNIPAKTAQIQPHYIAVDRANNLYISDDLNKRVYRVDNSGTLHSIAGNGISGHTGDGGAATAASLSGLSELTIDSCDNIFISEANGHIRKITFNLDCTPINVPEVTQSSATNVTFYPNPATETVTISTGAAIARISICNALGQVVLQQHPTGGNTTATIAIRHLPAGIYVVMVNGLYAGKLVKED